MKYLLLVLAFSIVITSCSRRTDWPENAKYRQYPAEDKNKLTWETLPVIPFKVYEDDIIFNYELKMLFPRYMFAPDNTYWTPPLEWLETDVIPYYKNYLEHLDVHYGSHFDCDDYARTFATFAHMKYYSNKKEKSMDGIAIGEVWFKRDIRYWPAGYAHAINVIIIEGGTVIYFEPQGCIPITLTPDEVESICLIKF